MHSDNGDSALYVQFYEREQVIPYASQAEGRPIMRMVDYVKIQVPGNNLLTIDTIADGSHKARFPHQWAQYQANKTNDQIQGTLLTAWSALTAAQAMEMRHFKFYTVEQVAEAPENNLVQPAAIAGMAPTAFKAKAAAFLAASKETALAQSQAVELEKRDQEIAALKEQVAALISKVDAPRRGRPPKEGSEE